MGDRKQEEILSTFDRTRYGRGTGQRGTNEEGNMSWAEDVLLFVDCYCMMRALGVFFFKCFFSSDQRARCEARKPGLNPRHGMNEVKGPKQGCNRMIGVDGCLLLLGSHLPSHS